MLPATAFGVCRPTTSTFGVSLGLFLSLSVSLCVTHTLAGAGPIGALYLKLHEEYMKAGIAFGSWESDNTMGRIPSIDRSGKTHGGWCFEVSKHAA